jgi:hypothetical protein
MLLLASEDLAYQTPIQVSCKGTVEFQDANPAMCSSEEVMEMNWFLEEAGTDKETAQREFVKLLIFDQ